MRLRFLPLLLALGCSSAGGVAPEDNPRPGASGKAGQGDAGSGGDGPEAGQGGADAGKGGSGEAGLAGQGGAGTSASGASGASPGQGGAGTGGAGQGGAGQSQAGAGQAGAGQSQGGAGAAGNPFGGGGEAGATAAGAAGAGGECGDGATGPAEVYAHSSDELYRIDADTKALTVVGSFSGCSTVIDIAIDKAGNLFGTTSGALVKIDKTTAKCTTINEGDYPNSLSFVPAGTVFADKEALVGYNGSTYVVIDEVTGSITEKGTLSGGYSSSGDIVSVIGGGTYLTVKGNECGDCLVRVDPATGDLIENLGPTGFFSVYGLAFWGGELYGFTDPGELFTYDLSTKKVKEISIANAPAFLSFYGAGSTTCARLTKPLPRGPSRSPPPAGRGGGFLWPG